MTGQLDRVEEAADRLRLFAVNATTNHPNGYAVMDSGGKDSGAIKTIAMLSGVPFEIIHSHTTADHPLTVQFVREEQKRWQARGIPYTIVYPTFKGNPTSMWRLIEQKGPPTRIRRWCCDYLKEQTAGQNRFTVTGVRWSESVRRKQNRSTFELPSGQKQRIKLNNDNDAQRKLTEHCMRKGQVFVNPIIDWRDGDVWELHQRYHIPYNPLYDMGKKRIGCIGCPMGQNKRELEQHPNYKQMYVHAFQRFLNRRPDLIGYNGWLDGESLYQWWIENYQKEVALSGQLCFFDEDENEEITP